MSRYDWQKAQEPAAVAIKAVSQALKVPKFLAALLIQRGIKTPQAYEAFARPDISRLHDPMLLHDMDKAVARIQQAVEKNEKITIYGDYDVDGLTATSIMLETLQGIGAEPEVFIPDRFTDGYGPNAAVYKYLQARGTKLLITVDNGVSGKAVIDPAMENGMDVIVTDHHELPKELPNAVAVVHPRYPGTKYPFGDLSGAGVAFKVASALLGQPPVDSIDLAALGTVADLVSLTDENRVIVQMGLALIRSQPRAGIAALLAAAGVDSKDVDETTVGFRIGPRLNALGRMGDATPGVTLLTTFDEDEANALAQNADKLNQQRQELVKKISATALQMAQTPENQKAKTLVLAHQGWHEGVVGIVASKVVETTGKPTLVLNISKDGATAKGSGRSVEAYHLFNSIEPAKDLLTSFGGHHMAVGLTLPAANLQKLHAVMEEAAKTQLKDAPKPALTIDATLTKGDLTLENYKQLRQMAPFGSGNTEPVFSFLPQSVSGVRAIGKDGSHLKFQADGVDVIAFGRGQDAQRLDQAAQAKLAVTLDENTWNGQSNVQLQLKDWQLHAPDVIDMRLPRPSAEQFRGEYTYLFFSAKVKQRLGAQFQFGGPLILIKDLKTPAANAVIVDLPPDEAALKAAMKLISLPVRIIFYGSAASLVNLPTRLECGRVLQYLRQHPGFDKHHLPALAQAVHLTTLQVIFAVQVFFELGFVTIEGALISATPNPAKKQLTTAHAYQARAAFLTLAHHLQEDDVRMLNDQLTSI